MMNDAKHVDEPNGVGSSRRAWSSAIALFTGSAIALLVLNFLFAGKSTDFADAASMGAQTTSLFAKVDGHLIHGRDIHDAADCLAGVEARKATQSALWLGNSQLHAVNQWKEGETNSTPILFDLLKKKQLDLITFSPPNASLQEHYVLFEYLRRRIPLNILIIGICFDDTREIGLRPEIRAMADDLEVASALAQTGIGRDLLAMPRAATGDQDTAGISHSLQERVEKSINGYLSETSPLWQARLQARGELLNALYEMRNVALGIKATTKRRVIRGRYQLNISAIEAILNLAQQHGIRVLSYITPIRHDVGIPYDPEEYRRFKDELAVISNRYGSALSNLEDLVPAEYWGVKASTSMNGSGEIDFMHFQAEGHRILASHLFRLITLPPVNGAPRTDSQ